MAIRVRNVEELLDILDEDIRWRKKEISDMKSVAQSENMPDYLLRAGFVMLCAHFEGFIRFASNAYIAYISSKKLKTSCLKSSFSAITLRLHNHSLFNASNGEKVKTSVVKQLIEEYHSLLDKDFVIKVGDDSIPFVDENSPPIQTDSNPSSKVLQEISSILNLDYNALFQQRAPFIDCEILNPRHHIAHGRRRPMEHNAYIEVHDYILGILDNYKDAIINEAVSDSFLAS